MTPVNQPALRTFISATEGASQAIERHNDPSMRNVMDVVIKVRSVQRGRECAESVSLADVKTGQLALGGGGRASRPRSRVTAAVG